MEKIKTKLDSEERCVSLFVVPLLAGLVVGLIFLIILVGGGSVGWGAYFLTVGVVSVLGFEVIWDIIPQCQIRWLNVSYLQKGIIPSWKEASEVSFVSFSEVIIPFEHQTINLKELTDKMRAKTLTPAEESLIIFEGSEQFQEEFTSIYQGRFLDEKTFEQILMKKPSFLFKLTGFSKKQLLQIIKQEKISPLLLYRIEEEGKEADYLEAFLNTNTGKIVFAKKTMDANIFSLIWDLREDEEILEALQGKLSKHSLILMPS